MGLSKIGQEIKSFVKQIYFDTCLAVNMWPMFVLITDLKLYQMPKKQKEEFYTLK
jgi:hypothetical protein